jgi:sterol desaturase/sphingolipid hydroxylase (fatty acid hydroxylase superfamily)
MRQAHVVDPRLVLAISSAALALFIVVDARDEQFRASWWRDKTRRNRNIAFALANLATMAVLNAVTHALAHVLPKLVEWRGPVVVEIIACLVVAEGVNWISHWVKHRQPWLWTFHAPHHVETQYSVNLTLHTHGLEVLVSGALMAAVLDVLGFSQLSVDVFSLSYFFANLYKHCTAKLSLGVLDYVIVSPAYHRLHHARGVSPGSSHGSSPAFDGNFGSVLTIFDVLFRTAKFPRTFDETVVAYGSDDEFGFVREMLRPLAFGRFGRRRQRDGQLAGGLELVDDGQRGRALALLAPTESAHVRVDRR